MHEVILWMRRLVETAGNLSGGEMSSRVVEIAGLCVELRFDNDRLRDDYLARLCARPSGGQPCGSISVMLCEERLADMPPPPVITAVSPVEFHEALAAHDMLATYPVAAGHWQFFDRRSRTALLAIRRRDDLPPWDGSAPLRLPLQWLLDEWGLRVVHAATVGVAGKGAVLFGRGGAGKSGTTLAALSVGMSSVGDDYVALRLHGAPAALPLYNCVKQDLPGLERVPGLRDALQDLTPNWRGKYEFDPRLVFPGAFVDEMALHAVILPKIVQRPDPSIEQVSSSAALLALLSSNLQYNLTDKDGGMGKLASFLRQLPCYQMNLSTSAHLNGLALKSFLADL
jgi:hypothetical protein